MYNSDGEFLFASSSHAVTVSRNGPVSGIAGYLAGCAPWIDKSIQTALNPRLRPKYVARVELRVYVSDEDDLGREAIVPEIRFKIPSWRAEWKGGATRAIAEPIIVPLLGDPEIEEAFVAIKDRESAHWSP